jgi:hypothetical protein
MGWWGDLLDRLADWDLDSREPISGTELRRRLQIIGRAVAATEHLNDFDDE